MFVKGNEGGRESQQTGMSLTHLKSQESETLKIQINVNIISQRLGGIVEQLFKKKKTVIFQEFFFFQRESMVQWKSEP